MDGIDVWIGVGALLIGATALLTGIVTGQIRLQLNDRESIERRLARLPASAGAVIVRGQPLRALWRVAPYGLIALVVSFGLPYLKHYGLGDLCERFDAATVARWTQYLVFYGLPCLFIPFAAREMVLAIRVLQGGYAPPLDAVLMQDTVAVTGWRAKTRGTAGLVLMPLMAGFALYVGHGGYQAFADTRTGARLIQHCPAVTAGDTP